MDAPEQFDDLEALRTFRASDAVPPVGLLDRLRDDLQLAINAEVRTSAPAAVTTPPRWLTWRRYIEHRLFRPSLVAGAAACLVIAIAAVGALGNRDRVAVGASTSATQASTSLFDSTAQRLFGGNSAAPAVVDGVLDARDDSTDIAHAITDHSRDSDEYDLLRRLSRDPNRLLDTFRASARDAAGADATASSDQVAFVLAMSLVTDAKLPADLRAAVLRSVSGLDGIEAAAFVNDDLGRTGILISHLDAASGVRDQYVLDQSSGALREARSFTSSYLDPACPPGTFTGFRLYDDAGHEVAPAQLPTLAWPDIVTSCSPASSV